MKRFFLSFSFVFFGFFSFISSSLALTPLQDSMINDFQLNFYDEDYPYCVFHETYGNRYFICFSESQLDSLSIKQNKENINNYYYLVPDMTLKPLFVKASVLSNELEKFNYTFNTISSYEGYIPFTSIDSNYVFSNFDFYLEKYDGSKSLFTSNFQFSEKDFLYFNLPDGYSVVLKDSNYNIIEEIEENSYYISYGNYYYYIYFGDTLLKEISYTFNSSTTLKPFKQVSFNIPDSSIFVLKDIEGNIINPVSNNTYFLLDGSYFYDLSKEGYYSLSNEQININSDITITLDLESKFNSSDFQSIFTKYYNYLNDLVSKIFPLENPLFLFLITFFIGFSLIAIIKKLIGGFL